MQPKYIVLQGGWIWVYICTELSFNFKRPSDWILMSPTSVYEIPKSFATYITQEVRTPTSYWAYTVANMTNESEIGVPFANVWRTEIYNLPMIQPMIPQRCPRRARRWPATQIWQLPTVYTKHFFHRLNNGARFQKTAATEWCRPVYKSLMHAWVTSMRLQSRDGWSVSYPRELLLVHVLNLDKA